MKNKDNSINLLEYFFEFVNFNLDELDFDNLVAVAMSYVRFAYASDRTVSKSRYDMLTKSVFEQSGEELKKVKTFLEKLQSHSRNLLDEIINSPDTATSLAYGTGWQVSINDGKFIIGFSINDEIVNALDIGHETKIVEAILTALLINTPLVPNQFKICEECGNYFYQKTKREMKFCSTQCSNRNRQRVFVRGGSAVYKGTSIKIPEPVFKKKK